MLSTRYRTARYHYGCIFLPPHPPPLVSLCVDLDEGEIGNRGGLRSPEQARCIMRTLPPRILIT